MSNIKGSAWLNYYKKFGEVLGDEKIEILKTKLSESDHQKLFGRTILPISWVDFGAHINFGLLADAMFGNNDLSLIKEVITKAVGENFKGIYKVFISFTSPKFIIEKTANVWAKLYDKGNLICEWQNDKSIILKLINWPDIPPGHEIILVSSFEGILKISGAKNIQVNHNKCIVKGAENCQFEASWD